VPTVKFPLKDPEFVALVECSARLGSDPLLVQGSTGNTSIKTADTLWIKASGHWLANAGQEAMFVPVDLSAARHAIGHHIDPSITTRAPLRASVETAMHCVIPWRVVMHVHSVNSIAWAVRRDGEEQLRERLRGVPWKWIPYVASGLALAREIEHAVFADPGTRVFILGNHGIVVAGTDCCSAYDMLLEVEKRVAAPSRLCSAAGCNSNSAMLAKWLSEDSLSRHILSGGYLYPCHALFLPGFGPCPRANASELKFTPEAAAALNGLAEVISRLPGSAPLRYLTLSEVDELVATNAYHAAQLQDTTSAINIA
jgi:ribulose-5-phosphate 4-epimerase/fuculose-1-phosphate aldolase